jgi:hypothetical protein
MGVAPEAILEKDFFEYRLEIECNPSDFNSKYFILEILQLRDTSTSRDFNCEILYLRDTSTSRDFNFEILYLRDTLRISYRRIRVHNSIKDFQSLSLRVGAPKAIIEKSFTHNLL